MSAFQKWVAMHKTPAFCLISAVEIVAYGSLLYLLSCPIWGLVLMAGFLLCFNYLFVHVAHAVVLKKPLDALSCQGDPEPLLHITAQLLTAKHHEADRQALLINHCVALRELGELQRAMELLSGLNIDKSAGAAPAIKVIYYHNLADLCDLLGDAAGAEIWLNKSLQIYNDMPDNKLKRGLKDVITLTTAEQLISQGQGDEAARLLQQLPTDQLTVRVSAALLRARICLLQNDRKTALLNLRDVVRCGNKLYAVRQAQQRIQELETSGVDAAR